MSTTETLTTIFSTQWPVFTGAVIAVPIAYFMGRWSVWMQIRRPWDQGRTRR